MDQSTLAERLNRSKSSISRILSGVQEPKLSLAHELAKALGVSLDYLADDSLVTEPDGEWVMLSEDEVAILKIVRRLGIGVAIDRLLVVPKQNPNNDYNRSNHSDSPPS